MTGSLTDRRYGVDSLGVPALFDPQAHHTAVAGATRSGKSVTTYAILADLAALPWVQIVGIDPSSILLAPHAQGRESQFALGTSPAALGQALDVLHRLEGLMDARIAKLAALGIDKVPTGWRDPRLPTVWLILEEYAGLLAAADKTQTTEVVRVVGRLLREGAKAAIFVLTILQRPEAAVLHDRAQYSRRIVHRLDNGDSVRMLLEAATPETVARHMDLAPGLSVVHEAGEPYRLVRSDYLDYGPYAAHVRAVSAGKPPLFDPPQGM